MAEEPAPPVQSWQTDAQRIGWETFCAQLLQLLETSPRQWVAYRGAEQIGIREVKLDLYYLIQERNIPLTEVTVRKIEPLGPPVNLGRPRRRALLEE